MKKYLCLLLILTACSSVNRSTSTNLRMSVVEGRYEMNECEEDWSVVQLEGLSNLKAQLEINNFLMSKITKKSCNRTDDVSGERYSTKVSNERIFPHYIVIRKTVTVETGSPEPQVNSLCMVFDLKNGHKIDFESLLLDGYQNFVKQLIVNQIWEGKGAEAEEYKQVLRPGSKSFVELTSSNVCPTGKGLVLQFQTLEIAPNSFKTPEIQVGIKEWPLLFKVNPLTKELFGHF